MGTQAPFDQNSDYINRPTTEKSPPKSGLGIPLLDL
uniref:Uncharacterized protein n=1 Tax=Anguilla anguilla TaxID=7936 RepID=A0A0E9QDH0_ANGAN